MNVESVVRCFIAAVNREPNRAGKPPFTVDGRVAHLLRMTLHAAQDDKPAFVRDNVARIIRNSMVLVYRKPE